MKIFVSVHRSRPAHQSNFTCALFRERAFVFHILYAVMFTTTLVRRLLKHALYNATGRLLEKVKRVMTSFWKNCSNLKRPLLRAEASVFHVPYAVTFRPTSSTRLHKHTDHVLTDQFADKIENAMSSIRARQLCCSIKCLALFSFIL